MHRLTYILSILSLILIMPACGDDDDSTSPSDTTQDTTATGGTTTTGGATTTGGMTTGGTTTTGGMTMGGTTSAGGTTMGDMVPTDGAALQAWLAAGSYLSWPAESSTHPSTGPHFGNVRTFINPALDASLAAGNATHPVGAAAVKELYGDAGTDVLGYAVEVKVTDGSDGASWYWYEDFNGNNFADGTGVGLCTGCHSGGTDFVLVPYPLQ